MTTDSQVVVVPEPQRGRFAFTLLQRFASFVADLGR